MLWLAEQLNQLEKKVFVKQAETSKITEKAIYRFFELFDWKSIQEIEALFQRQKVQPTQVTPPLKPHLEEKLWLSLLWVPSLKSYWEKSLRFSHLERLKTIIPRGLIVEDMELSPLAAMPYLNIYSWEELKSMSQKQRRYVLKVSGFNEEAWGSRGVFCGT